MLKGNAKKIVLVSMFAALCCVATMILKIPSPFKGYINLGDCIVLLAGWLLSPGYAFIAAGLGSALADVFSGYMIYVPATFIIKGLMAVVCYFCFKKINGKVGETPSRVISGISAELIMVFGYAIFESFLYGIPLSIANIPINAVQGAVGLIISVYLIKLFKKTNIF